MAAVVEKQIPAINECPDGEPNSANLHSPITISEETKNGLGYLIKVFSNAITANPAAYAATMMKTRLYSR